MCRFNQMQTIFSYTVMLTAHLQDGKEKFIGDVKAYPEPVIILASDQQLRDLERFGCDPFEFSALTTGDFDVTPTTYRHLLLHSKAHQQATGMFGSDYGSLQKNLPNILPK